MPKKKITNQQLAKSIDDLARIVKQGFDDVGKQMDKRFDDVEERLEKIELKLDNVPYRFELEDLEKTIAAVRKQVAKLQKKL
jgi:polyhydroxyalkanoate synthesis regulator phasin